MRSRAFSRCLQAAACTSIVACTPTLNWRDVRPDGSRLLVQFPCRPDFQQREVLLVGARVPMRLYACHAGGRTWALSFADIGVPASVEKALVALRQATAASVQASDPTTMPLRVPGSTAATAAGRVRLDGHRADGQEVELQLALFARGTEIYQATVIGRRGIEDVDTFFDSLQFDK